MQTLIQRINKRVRRTLNILHVQPPTLGSKWIEKNFYLSQESSAIEGPMVLLPYQVAMANLMSNDDVPEVTVMKSIRIGYTKLLLATVFFYIFRHRSAVIWNPVDGDSDRFVKVEVDNALRDCPPVRDLLKSDPEKRNSDNTLNYKGFIGSNLDLRGGKSAKNYRAMTKDLGVYDELDGFDVNIDNEGSAVGLGDKRMLASPFPKSIRGSTPKLKSVSQIEKLFKSAEVRLYRYLPCPHCFHSQRLQWSNVKFDNRDYKTTRYECESCAQGIDYSEYADMDRSGTWRTIDGKTWCDETGSIRSVRDNSVLEVRHAAMFIWGAYSYFMSWNEMVRQFLIAKDVAADTGDTTELQTFTNTVFAETWDTHQGDQPSWEIIRARAEPYPIWTVPMAASLLVAAVDVQRDRIEYLVESYGEGEERWIIGHEIIMGDPFSQEPWDILDEWLGKTYLHESGAMLRIADCGIDAGFATHAVYNYVRTSKHRVTAIKGANIHGKPIIGRPTPQDVTYGGRVHKGGIKLWPVGVYAAKMLTYARFKLTEPGPGYYHTPIGLPDSFYQQATAERLVTTMVKGFPIENWYTNSRNEITDLNAYCYAIATKNGLYRLNWAKRQEKLQKESEQATFLQNRQVLSDESRATRPQIDSDIEYL